MEIPRQATVLRLVLVALAREPAPSVSKLARDIGVSRSSVSRALHQLDRGGLVEHNGAWSLTRQGDSKSAELISDAPRDLADKSGAAQRRLEHGRRLERILPEVAAVEFAKLVENSPAFGLANSATLRFIQSMENSPAFGLANSAALRELQGMQSSASRQFVESLARIDFAPISPQISAAFATLGDSGRLDHLTAVMDMGVTAALDAQRVFTDASRAVEGLSALSLGPAASLASDLEAIRLTVINTDDLASRAAGAVGASAANLVGAYRDALGEFIRGSEAHARFSVDPLGLSSHSTAAYVSGAREIVEGRRSDAPSARSGSSTPQDLLAGLDARIAEIRLGAWHAVETGGPDWQRHAAHGGRELLRHVLEILAPSDDVKARFGEVTRKNRIRYAIGDLSESEREWAEALAESVTQTLDFLSAEAKSRGRPRFGLVGATGVLMSLDGLVVVLISSADGRP